MMRFNKQELATLAMQPSTKFEKEGILYIRERQEGFFRKSESKSVEFACLAGGKKGKLEKHEKRLRNLSCVGGITKVNLERWCRLRGNLLFYFKSKDPWSEPLGVVVLEQCQVRLDPPMASAPLTNDGHYPFYLVFDGGLCQALASTSEFERASWMEAIRTASYEGIRAELNALRQCIERRRNLKPNVDLQTWRLQQNHTLDISEVPMYEMAMACDNLLCDGHGRPPNPTLVVDAYMPAQKTWVQYGRTEIIEKSSNPQFLSTISFRASDGLTGESRLRFTVFDVQERVSHTAIPLGSSCVLLSAIQDSTRLRIPLSSRQSTTAGFLTVCAWSLEAEDKGSSTDHTPARVPSVNANHAQQIWSHRRSQSLPPRLGVKMRLPSQSDLKLLFSSPYLQTYRFHSGLGGDISVHEYMAESKLCFSFPHQMLDVWILQEKELLQEVAGMGELREPWHSRQVELLDRHLHLLRLYSQARENLQAHKGPYFKKSSRKTDRSLEFVPINMHLQRMWVHNDTLNKSGFYDWITVGAFTAHSHRSKNGGLIRLVQQLKESPMKANSNYQIATKISMANDAIQAIKQLRREVVEAMKSLMRLAKEKQTNGMLPICEDMINKTRILLSLWDPGLVEEALSFIEEHKLTQADDSGLSEDLSLDSVGGRPSLVLSPFKRITQQLTLDLKSPELEDFATPCVQKTVEDLWKVPSSESNLLNTSDGLKTLCSSMKTPDESNFVLFPDVEDANLETSMDSGQPDSLSTNGVNSEADPRAKMFLDTIAMCNSPSANYYKPTEEPEPWDITQLNIEASVMCLVSKVKFLCGRCGSPAVRLKQHSTGRRKIVPSAPKSDDPVDKGLVRNGNKFTEGLDLSKISDWASELRPSMRKLRQAMDGLLKTARLTHSVFRVQEDPKAAQRVCNVRYRRDVCFSQALSSLATGLMTRLWCHKPDPAYIATLGQLGPLAHFEGLLSYYGNEIDMWGDMSVAIEDLRTVLFVLVRSPSPSVEPVPTPKVSGTRNSLTVSLPVPDNLYSLLPSRQTFSFHVTPVFFNIGINEMASIAEGIGATKPQERANIDNFDRLYEYFLRYRKINRCDNPRQSAGSSNCRPLIEMIEELRAEVHGAKPKNVAILRLSAQISRHMKGIRFTSCKSAKDRTGMSVTLEQCRILAEEYHLAEHEFQRALDCMRSEGCRRENTMKNIGLRKYAFNAMQLLAFPKHYKPPPGTYGSAQS
ncbi:inositol polyphosphate-4-phosphatase type I A isoform X2 [Dendroctonus ponderosae]|uniref:inositol polyphosphate-4-phosphatase type I A isoform X2 n=1 Tax=Dendroctonus ponderosae TaxID=77166 RepID=UPI002034B5D0|nr:inositol polyphosphate-4-phosphatase type I A isoform X2 [Dendroctonus ponderosae]XP_048525589.1 inositol polyphosphate-4-phosphatase type I A isoform X2 [Dendroctonus ponderosae]